MGVAGRGVNAAVRGSFPNQWLGWLQNQNVSDEGASELSRLAVSSRVAALGTALPWADRAGGRALAGVPET